MSMCRKAYKHKDKVVEEGTTRGKTFYSLKGYKKKCKSCNGKGKWQEDGEDMVCTKCHTNGYNTVNYNVVFDCNGKYTYMESCDCDAHAIHGGLADMRNICFVQLAVYYKINGIGMFSK